MVEMKKNNRKLNLSERESYVLTLKYIIVEIQYNIKLLTYYDSFEQALICHKLAIICEMKSWDEMESELRFLMNDRIFTGLMLLISWINFADRYDNQNYKRNLDFYHLFLSQKVHFCCISIHDWYVSINYTI